MAGEGDWNWKSKDLLVPVVAAVIFFYSSMSGPFPREPGGVRLRGFFLVAFVSFKETDRP